MYLTYAKYHPHSESPLSLSYLCMWAFNWHHKFIPKQNFWFSTLPKEPLFVFLTTKTSGVTLDSGPLITAPSQLLSSSVCFILEMCHSKPSTSVPLPACPSHHSLSGGLLYKVPLGNLPPFSTRTTISGRGPCQVPEPSPLLQNEPNFSRGLPSHLGPASLPRQPCPLSPPSTPGLLDLSTRDILVRILFRVGR